MWKSDFQTRFLKWAEFRDSLSSMPLEEALSAVNTFWQSAPWQPYSLHWDDQTEWPNPWELLEDNSWCYLAKSLGIAYTLLLSSHADSVIESKIIRQGDLDLVQINDGKYMLNMDGDEIVNIHTDDKKNITKFVTFKQLKDYAKI